MAESAILQLEHVTRQFSGMTAPAVQDITLTLPQGDLLALLGPSGCGKTTLLRIIAGFEPLQAGTVTIAGRKVAAINLSVPPEKRSVGMVFQDFALFPHLTLAQNVAFGLQKLSKNTRQHQRVAEVIALVGLEGLERRYPHELSGGQQQRVALARALAPQPALILLDEPFSNLDVHVRSYLRHEVRTILKATGTSAIFVTHDQEEALSISDHVAVMRQGQIEQIGTPEEVYRRPRSRFIAEFVTQANFLPARFRNNVWETEVGCFNCCGSRPVPASTGELMIPQEDLLLEPNADSPVVIRDRQFLGRERRYCLLTPSGYELHARTHVGEVLPIGTRVQLSVAEQSLQFFPAGEKRAQLSN